MTTLYPTALDTATTMPPVVDNTTRIVASHHNNQSDALIAVEGKIGIGASTPTSGKLLIGDGTGSSAWRTLLAADIPDISATYQPLSAKLTSVAALTYASVSFVKMTGANTFALDTTVLGSIATQAASSVSITGGTVAGLTGLAIRDTSAAYDVTIAAVSNTALTAAKTLTINMVNVSSTIKLGYDLTLSAATTIGGTNTGDVTLATNHGLSLTNQVIGMGTPSTLTSSTTNAVTTTTHTHAITPSPTLLGNGTAQYQTIVTGGTPFAPVYSGFLLDGTTGGKTVFSVTNTKVLTLLATDTYTLTIAGVSSINQDVQTTASPTFAGAILSTGGALKTGTSAGNTLLLQAYDTNLVGYVTFATLTANDTPTMDLTTDVTIGSAYIYRAGGTDIPPADGGTGVSNGTNNTITFTGNYTLGLTLTGNTAVTLPTTGTLVSSVTTGNGVSATNTAGALSFSLGVITPTSVNGLTLVAAAVGFTIAGGTTSKTLTVPLDASVSGTNTGDNAANSSTMYIGTTAVALNRASAALVLTGITSIDGAAATVTGYTPASGSLTLDGADAITLRSTAATDITLPTTGTLATLAGAETLTNKLVKVTAVPADDHTVSGTIIALTATANMAFGDVGYIASTGKVTLIDADAIASMSGLVMCCDATINADASGNFLLMGVARDDTWAWTVGGLIYGTVTGTSGNTLSQTAPIGTDDVVQILGVALTADVMLFNPSLVQTELV